MKTVLLMLLALAFVPASSAPALARDSHTLDLSCFDSYSHWAPRHDTRDARLAITTDDRDVTLLLTDEVVAVQLSDRVFHRIEREFKWERDAEEDNVLARAIKTAVLSSVMALLDHSAECSIQDIKDVKYADGRLVFVSEDDEEVFDGLLIDDGDDDDVLRRFSERDARAFVREFHRVKARI